MGIHRAALHRAGISYAVTLTFSIVYPPQEILSEKAKRGNKTPVRQGPGTGSITVVQDSPGDERGPASKQQCAC